MCREGRHVTDGELHLGEPGEGVDDKVPDAFMCREGRQVVSCILGEPEGVDDKVPCDSKRRDGRRVTGEKCSNSYLNLSQVFL